MFLNWPCVEGRDLTYSQAKQVVDYTNPSSLHSAFLSVNADTLLSFIVNLQDPESAAQSHRNLLPAAVSAGCIKRFIPAEYANNIARFPVPPSSETDKLQFREHVVRTCRENEIEYALVCNGVIMDFFIPRGRKRYFADLPPEFPPILLIDIPVATETDTDRPWVDVLGNPADKISLTLADDIAAGVVRFLQSPRGSWDEITYFSGDRVSWEEVGEILERVLEREVERRYTALEGLKREVREARGSGDAVRIECAELREAFGNGSEVLPVNAECFEGVGTTRFEDVVRMYYGNR